MTRSPDDPAQVGRYQLLERIGAGAMGVVHIAYDPQLDRRVALKRVRDAARPDAQTQVRREALALARVNHPNVVAVYEVGDAGDELFIAMEYVAGASLAEWLAAEQPDDTTILSQLIAVGEGLAAAHAEGLVHRDFKPANVVVGADGRARVIDFGLARASEAAEPTAPVTELDPLSAAVTRTGVLRGTPAYMAPEVLDGGAPSPASDQFSFCVTLYEALCGAPPFPRDSMPLLRHAMAQGDISTPRPLDKGVLRALRRGLAADPARRWPDMPALLAALARAARRRGDADTGVRARVLFVGMVIVGVVAAQVRLRVQGPPEQPWHFVAINGGFTALLLLFAGALHRFGARTAFNSRLKRTLVVFAAVKQLTLVMGARQGLTVQQLFAVDVMMIVGLFAISSLYMRVDARLPLAAMAVPVGLIFALPQHTVTLHNLSVAVLILSLVVVEWRTRRAARPPTSAPTTTEP